MNEPPPPERIADRDAKLVPILVYLASMILAASILALAGS